ncbi:hypothetical protein BDV25DRAFT_152126 [Aspergillus avenaceus]|uniref:Cns1/TTC4 wheel domain-containing protein n=1 Tax=Aspergillus avenaceus TaxID=36643 RepID=A0A5N6TZJ0_ASPAV|nr:hypothetical protein BDV25DRAFT_152126 [Aspergillus avenaceus]
MGQIEELPDDFDESLDLNRRSETKTETAPAPEPASKDNAPAEELPFPVNEERLKQMEESDPKAPKMPPVMASIRSHTTEELADMMNKTPLFMTDISKAGDEKGENTFLDAIQAIQNEGTRGEVAQSYREQGNEAAQEKRWADAKEFYNKAIAVVLAKENKWDKPENADEEKKLLRQVEEASYINRALCHLELGNYRSCTLDCASILKLNPKNIKAFYRSAMACYKLDKIAEAEDAASRGLALDPENKSLQLVSGKIAERKALIEQVAAKRRAENEKSKKEKQLLDVALKARQIRTRKTEQPPDMDGGGICLTPDPLSPESTVEFPTVLLYHMDAQSDFIKGFPEMTCIEDHLDYIFPLPWDEKGEYTVKNVECFMETVTGGLIKAGKKLPLLQILGGGKVEVVDELVRIYVIPSAKTGQFISEMKTRKESQ